MKRANRRHKGLLEPTKLTTIWIARFYLQKPAVPAPQKGTTNSLMLIRRNPVAIILRHRQSRLQMVQQSRYAHPPFLYDQYRARPPQQSPLEGISALPAGGEDLLSLLPIQSHPKLLPLP